MIIFELNNMTGKEKRGVLAIIERVLVEQAVNQHFEKDEKVKEKGGVVDYRIDRDKECLVVEYANKEVWQYRCIDCGVDGMLAEFVEMK